MLLVRLVLLALQDQQALKAQLDQQVRQVLQEQPGPEDLLVPQALLELMVLLGLQVVVRLPVVLMVISTSIQVMTKFIKNQVGLGLK
tara:strand:+ start:809 stop:1069 length:261 start_codon:yes stop_codon:yes gene_type:complete